MQPSTLSIDLSAPAEILQRGRIKQYRQRRRRTVGTEDQLHRRHVERERNDLHPVPPA